MVRHLLLRADSSRKPMKRNKIYSRMAQLNLSSAPINLNALREHGASELVDILDSVRGKKIMVIDPQFTGPLGLVAAANLLKEHGVEKIHHLLDADLVTESKNIIYLVRPKVENMKMIARQVRASQKKEFSLFFVPRRTMICERVLEEEGVYENITIGEYQLDLIPLEDDVLTLALSSAYKECFLEVRTQYTRVIYSFFFAAILVHRTATCTLFFPLFAPHRAIVRRCSTWRAH
jgi:hypothetical protein